MRLTGTFGWIVSGLGGRLDAQADLAATALRGGGGFRGNGALLAVLPHTPPKGYGRPIAEVVGLPAVQAASANRSFVVFAARAIRRATR